MYFFFAQWVIENRAKYNAYQNYYHLHEHYHGINSGSHPQRCFLVAVKISTYKKKSLQNGKQSQFPCQTISFAHVLAGLCIGITPVAQALAAEGQLTRMTRWLSKHQRLRFMRHKICRSEILASGSGYYPHDDGVSEQVIKDQGATNLTDALKNSPAWVRFLRVRTVTPPLATPLYARC